MINKYRGTESSSAPVASVQARECTEAIVLEKRGGSIRRFGPEIPDGPATYGYVSEFKTWLCPSSTGELTLADETGNWAGVYINSLHSLLSEVGEMRDQIVAEIERGLAEVRAQRPKSNARLSAGVAEEIEYIHAYRAAHSPKELNQPAVLPESIERDAPLDR